MVPAGIFVAAYTASLLWMFGELSKQVPSYKMAYEADDAMFRPWIQKLVQKPALPADLRMALSLEVQGGAYFGPWRINCGNAPTISSN